MHGDHLQTGEVKREATKHGQVSIVQAIMLLAC
jgi:hypothetical protein